MASPVAFSDPSGQFIDFASHVLHLGFAVAGIYGSVANFQLAAQEFSQSIDYIGSGNIEGFLLFVSGLGHTLLGVLGAAGAGTALANFNAFPGALRLVGGGTVPIAISGVTALEYGAAASAAIALWTQNETYTNQSRRHVSSHGHSANQQPKPTGNPKTPLKSRFRVTEGGQKFSNEVINHPQVRITQQSNGRILYEVDDLGRITGYDQFGNPTRGGSIVVEGQSPQPWFTYSPGEVVTQFPK